VASSSAEASTIVRTDAKGRSITLDVRAAGVDVDWYADVMRRTLHGEEIESAVIRIVPERQIRFYCGLKATSCYVGDWDGGTLTVQAGRGHGIAAVIRHEYAHHLDAAYDLTLTDSSQNRAEGWWRARKIEQRLRRGEVSHSTRRGWNRSIREIFAEDYVRLHMKAPYRIGWLAPPGRRVLNALRDDIRSALPTYA
jgi:hypothetical protein